MKRLVGIFAHPDDESYMAAGTIAKYAKAGWTVNLVCATRGEDASVRSTELDKAAATMGVSSVTFLDYKDGEVASLTPGKLEEKLITLLSETQPDVVITMEPSGVTNNPDNIKLTLAVTFSFQKYAFDRNLADAADSNPPKLYYACMPESIVSYFVKQKYFPEESYGRPWKGVEDKRITTVIDISRGTGAKEKALRSYLSQESEIDRYLEIPNNPFLKQEYFILRYAGLVEAFMGKNDRFSDRL